MSGRGEGPLGAAGCRGAGRVGDVVGALKFLWAEGAEGGWRSAAGPRGGDFAGAGDAS